MPKCDGYKTKQREVIEKVFALSGGHVTVDSLLEKLNKKGESVGRTTVYRTLEKLESEGKARKYISSPGESACYQYISKAHQCSEHFHLKCESCGRLIHIECVHITELSKHISDTHNFKVNNLKTVLYGVCEECAVK
ncbi:MAG: transcriptional repressor [Clostridia bacterium]|nr:transcriptional repressor [Clostridia bacterium]